MTVRLRWNPPTDASRMCCRNIIHVIIERGGPIMRKKLVTIGSSLGIIIDKPILELLKINPETELEMETDGHNLVLKPVRTASKERGMAAYREVAQRHKKSLRKLAE